jgi:1-acyl-sn-glycerol-3-phosphate acyltransferase
MNDLIITEKTIDVKKVFTYKNPGLARLIPQFVFSYLRKIVHEDQNNKILFENKDKYGTEFVSACLTHLKANIKIVGVENIPASGKQILVSNHPLGGYDGLALMDMIGKIRSDFYFLSNDILLVLPNLRPLFVPINKHGSNQEYIKTLNNTFESENMILIFPAGLVSRKINGKIQDLEWKNTFLNRVIRNKRDLIPVFVEGRNSDWFYNLANLRKKLGIKSNIEMFYLVDEMYKQISKPITIYVGKPVHYSFFDKRMKNDEWIRTIRNFVYQLKDNNYGTFEQFVEKN